MIYLFKIKDRSVKVSIYIRLLRWQRQVPSVGYAFTNQSNKHLVSSYPVLHTVPGPGDTAGKRPKNKSLLSRSFYFGGEKETINKENKYIRKYCILPGITRSHV